MEKLLSSLNLNCGGDLEEWMQLALAVQEQRRTDRNVSSRRITRGTALYAIGELNRPVYDLLESMGLDWQGYRAIGGQS